MDDFSLPKNSFIKKNFTLKKNQIINFIKITTVKVSFLARDRDREFFLV
jgi:hypothetical protein